MKHLPIFLLLLLCLFLCSCAKEPETIGIIGGSDGPTSILLGEEKTFSVISQEEAKSLMDAENVLVLDVREQHEFDAGHIPGAQLLPLGEIEARASAVLPDKDKTILVYCRSGRRSKEAAGKLVQLGYTDIREFGGINDWSYEVEK